VGVGGRMDTLQCAVVLAKLDRFDWELARRAEIGARYQALLRDADIAQVVVRPDRDSVWAQYTVFVENRPAVQAALKAAEVPTAVHYPLALHRQPAYAAWGQTADCPHSERAAQRVMSLPMSADLSKADQDHVVASLARALQGTA
jgi:UDP-2-acetamido-2-deoxy-ribo-hexuluronate aminotransferase